MTAQRARSEAHERDLAIEDDEGVHFEHAWLDPGGRQGLLPRDRSVEGSRHAASTNAPATRPAEVYELPVEVAVDAEAEIGATR